MRKEPSIIEITYPIVPMSDWIVSLDFIKWEFLANFIENIILITLSTKGLREAIL